MAPPINPQIAILQCTAGYPPAWAELNLRVIETFREEFPDAVVGLSSHDSGIAMALVGYVLGARIIEKHFTLDRNMPGPDHRASLDPLELDAIGEIEEATKKPVSLDVIDRLTMTKSDRLYVYAVGAGGVRVAPVNALGSPIATATFTP